MNKKIEKILYLPNPRGFCAGVERAINIVELSLEKYGPPIYVRHEIVHNPWVVNDLEKKGVIFVDELDEIPDGQRVIFSAHGVSSEVKKEAITKKADYIAIGAFHKSTTKKTKYKATLKDLKRIRTVSYTHLTLPTIYSV